jgi:hypothetical protein
MVSLSGGEEDYYINSGRDYDAAVRSSTRRGSDVVDGLYICYAELISICRAFSLDFL